MLSALEHKIPPPVWGLILAALMYWLSSSLPMVRLDFIYLDYVAYVLIGLGVIIDLVSVALFFKSKTTVNPLKPTAQKLVISGMYRFSRNPMYLGMLLLLIGWWLYLAVLSPVLLVIVFVLIINRLQIIPEERVLAERFPEQYPDYCQRVRRWI